MLRYMTSTVQNITGLQRVIAALISRQSQSQHTPCLRIKHYSHDSLNTESKLIYTKHLNRAAPFLVILGEIVIP